MDPGPPFTAFPRQGDSQPIALVPRKPNGGLVEGLEALLERAKTGEIEGLAYVALRPDQKFEVKKIGWCSSLEMAGALAYALHDFLAKSE